MSLAYTGRLAPSPTGLLHLGHAATFLIAHNRARTADGQLLLRIDDLDPQRSKEHFIDAAKEDLRWLGLTWNAELRQSQRLDRYREAMQLLLQQGLAYACTCTRKDLHQATQAPHEETDDEPVYNNRCRPTLNLSSRPERSAVERPVYFGDVSSLPKQATIDLQPNTNYRFRIPDNEAIHFLDGNCGPQTFTAGTGFGDFLVWRKDGLPSYQLASVVDDADMHITEVVRGRDLKSTARQILLQRALNVPTPAFFHTDLLRDEQGQRLAKRNDALSLQALRNAGDTAADVRARVQALLHHTHQEPS